MSWLRVDDGIAQHPKLLRLPRAERWTWLEVLCWCARYRTEGHVSEAISEAVRAATPAFLNRCHELGLLDLNGTGEYHVHDWRDYNPKDPTKAERQARWRARRDAPVDAGVDAGVDDPVDGPPARARARDAGAGGRARPVPSPVDALQASTEGAGPKRATAPSPPPPHEAASASTAPGSEVETPPGRMRFACPYRYAGDVPCGQSFATEAELVAHQELLGHGHDREPGEARDELEGLL